MSEPYKLYRGRPLKDAAWSALVANSYNVIDNDEDEDRAMHADDEGCGLSRGCIKFFKKEYHYCNFFLGGAQRHIAKGTLYQCAKFYDYALIFFDKYRVRKAVTRFNFDKADDESEMLLAPQIGEYFSALEKYLLDSGALVLPEAKSDARKAKQKARSYKKTIAGTIESWQEELQPYIFEIADAQEATIKTLQAVETRLSAIEEVLKAWQPQLKITP